MNPYKNYVLLLVGLFLSHISIAQYDSIFVDNIYRTYLVHLPSNYDSNNNYPLVIAMHGGFGNAYNLENQSAFSVKADAENFIVVYPEGVTSPLGVTTWNAGWCCGYASNTNVDDVGFIDALLDHLINQISIDTDRIYAAGMSNGGYLSYRLACELSNRFAAIAPVAASMSTGFCDINRPIPIIAFHSYLDQNIPYDGGSHFNNVVPSQDSVMNFWSNLDSCLIINDTIVNNAEYTQVRWITCNCNKEIQYYITTDGGHSWPGGNGTPLGDDPSNYLIATDLIWDFFSKYSLVDDCNTVNVDLILDEDVTLSLYPNPLENWFQIKGSLSNYNIDVIDVVGNVLLSVNNVDEFYAVNISELPAGIYFISINNTNETHLAIKKIIKN